MDPRPVDPRPDETPRQARADHRPVIQASQWFGNAREVRLVYQGQEYRLHITRQGKLILTK